MYAFYARKDYKFYIYSKRFKSVKEANEWFEIFGKGIEDITKRKLLLLKS